MNKDWRTWLEVTGLMVLLFTLASLAISVQRVDVWRTNHSDARADEQKMYEQTIKLEAQRDIALDMQRETMNLTIRCIESYNQ